MSAVRLKKKYEKLVLELRYLTADYDYHRLVYGTAQQRFEESFEHWRIEQNLLTPAEARAAQGVVPKEEFTDVVTIEEDENTKKRIEKVATILFKKIAKATHPDKLLHLSEEERAKRLQMFIEARKASSRREWYRLLCIATDLAISLPIPTKEHITLLESKNTELRDTIQYMEKTYVWVYDQMPNEDSKHRLFKEFASVIGYVPAK